MPLIKVGPLPKMARGSGRRRGMWQGHESDAQELKLLAKREPEQWAVLLSGVKSPKAQTVATAINQGKASGFGPDEEGHFEASSRRSEEQGEITQDKDGKNVYKYDVWARYIYTGPEGKQHNK